MNCPLCQHSSASLFYTDARREYWRCDRCALVFVPPRYYLTPELEKAEYDKHENIVDDPGYRRFLGHLADPLLAMMPPACQVLEFGCGPGPALAAMLREAGHDVALYDAFYYPDRSVLESNRYDVLTATEVIEHLHHPAREIAAWLDYLKPHGLLGIMTKTVINAERFAKWHYKNDQTHICFYCPETFDYIASEYSLKWQALADDAFLFSR